MQKKSSLTEEEDISEQLTEEEEEETKDEEDLDYSRSRFHYSEFKFSPHSIYDKFNVNTQQYGHKKYWRYTQSHEKRPSVREISRSVPAMYRKLDDTDFSPRRKGKKSLLLFIGFIIGGLSFVGMLIKNFRAPQTNLNKIYSARDIVARKVNDLAQALNKPEFAETLIIGNLKTIGSLLNESETLQLTLEEIQNKNIANLIWKAMSGKASSCEAPKNQIILVMALYFLHDLTLAGGNSMINKGVAGKILENCNEVEDVTTALFMLLMSLIKNEDGLKSLNGIAPILSKSLVKNDFGPWDTLPSKFYALWTTSTNVSEVDRNGICKFVGFAGKNIDNWNYDINAMICLLSKTVECKEWDSIDLSHIYKKDECINILRQFNKD